MKKVVCVVVDGDFHMEDIQKMERNEVVTVTGTITSIFYGVDEFNKTMKLAQDMEEFVLDSGNVKEDDE